MTIGPKEIAIMQLHMETTTQTVPGFYLQQLYCEVQDSQTTERKAFSFSSLKKKKEPEWMTDQFNNILCLLRSIDL